MQQLPPSDEKRQQYDILSTANVPFVWNLICISNRLH